MIWFINRRVGIMSHTWKMKNVRLVLFLVWKSDKRGNSKTMRAKRTLNEKEESRYYRDIALERETRL